MIARCGGSQINFSLDETARAPRWSRYRVPPGTHEKTEVAQDRMTTLEALDKLWNATEHLEDAGNQLADVARQRPESITLRDARANLARVIRDVETVRLHLDQHRKPR